MSVNSSTYKKVLSKGKQNNLPEIKNGMLRFTTDTGRIYLDENGERIEFTDFVKNKTKEQILAIENPLPKVYLASDTHEILVYDTTSHQWVNYGGGESGGGLEAVDLTREEYDALTPEEKADPNKLYLVDDNIEYLTTQDIQYDTTSGWASKSTLVSRLNTIYVYTDHITKDNKNIPGFKVGDGVTYVNDLLFLEVGYAEYAENAGTAEFVYQADYATNAGTADEAHNSTYAETANYANNAGDAINAASSEYAYFAENAGTATYASYADFAGKAENADNADTASYAYFAENAATADYVNTVAWGNVTDKPDTYPPSSHTHATNISATNDPNQLNMVAGTRYKLNAGDTEFNFTTPPNSTYTTNMTTTNDPTQLNMAANTRYKLSAGGTEFNFTTPPNPTYTTNMATTSDPNQLNMVANTRYKISTGGTEFNFTTPPDNNTTYDNFSTASAGLVPKSSGIQDTFLRFDGQWAIPSGGGGGSNVSVTADLTTGTKIATMTIDAATTALYAPPNDSVIQRPITSGSGEILLSNGSTYGETRKYSDFNFNSTDKILTIKSPEGNDVDPQIYLWNKINIRDYAMMIIGPNDIEIGSNYDSDENRYYKSWDGTNISLQKALRDITHYGIDPPTGAIGRDGSIYFRITEMNPTPQTEVIEIYFKVKGVWCKYNPEVGLDYDFGELTEEPTGDVLLYDWDFTKSMVDTVEGMTNIPGAGIEDFSYTAENCHRNDERGLYADYMYEESAPIAQIPVDLRYPGYRVEIEFGEFTMNYSDYAHSIISSYSNRSEWRDYYDAELNVFLIYQFGIELYSWPSIFEYSPETTLINTEDPNYFANSKFTLRTVSIPTPELVITDPVDYQYKEEYSAASHPYNIAWEIYKDDVLIVTTPATINVDVSGSIGEFSEPNKAQIPTLGYITSNPNNYFSGISFGVPCNGEVIEIKSLKVYREN